MNTLVDCIKYLPNNLKILDLNLAWNKLGDNMDNIKHLEKYIKYIPNNLLHFTLNLYGNELGYNIEDINHLGYCIK